MIYVVGWLGIGVTTLRVIFFVTHLPGQKRAGRDAEPFSKSASDLLHAFCFSRESLRHRILFNLVAPVVAVFLAVAGWPYVIWMVFKDRLARMQPSSDAEFREFVVENTHLQELLSINAIEQREMVYDPMKAVPALPFGHLHDVWLKYLESLTEDCELWSFTAHWVSEQGVEELRLGYVAVLKGVPGAYLMTRCKSYGKDAFSAPIPASLLQRK